MTLLSVQRQSGRGTGKSTENNADMTRNSLSTCEQWMHWARLSLTMQPLLTLCAPWSRSPDGCFLRTKFCPLSVERRNVGLDCPCLLKHSMILSWFVFTAHLNCCTFSPPLLHLNPVRLSLKKLKRLSKLNLCLSGTSINSSVASAISASPRPHLLQQVMSCPPHNLICLNY